MTRLRLSLRPASILLFALASLLVSAPAWAAWPHDPVNGAAPVSVTYGDASNPVTLADGAGGAFVAWQEGGPSRIMVQHLNQAGVAQWAANGVPVTPLIASQYNPQIVGDGAGGLLVFWQDARAGNYDIYAQRVTAAGAMAWTTNGVPICTTAGDQVYATVVADGAGGAVLAWQDARSGPNDIYAQHVTGAGSPLWAANGVVVCNAAGVQQSVQSVSDGGGGALLVWQDARAGNQDIYAQRVFSATGTSAWTANGVAVCTAVGDQTGPALCTDGAEGAIVAWTDNRAGTTDIYAQRMWYAGVVLWAANGVVVNNAAGAQSNVQVVSDGAGGAIVAFHDPHAGYTGPSVQRLNVNGSQLWPAAGVQISTGSTNPLTPGCATSDGLGGIIVNWVDYRTAGSLGYAQRVNASGVTQWTSGGVGFDINPFQFNGGTVCSDGAGGAIFAGVDGRYFNATGFDAFAWHVDTWGVMGGEPQLAGVKDVPNDNGGLVKVSWNASPLDLDPASYAVSSYLVFRSAPPNVAARALRAGKVARSFADLANAATGMLYAQPNGAETYYWELIGQQSAYHLATYSLTAPTTGDSIGAGNPRTAFMVQARNGGGTQWWNSAPDSGYSVDNLSPVAPAPFTGEYSAGTTTLHWDPNAEADLAGYRLYRGTSSGFVPGPGNLVAALADTGYTDPAGAPYYYKLTAIDVHGNESPVATLLPSGTTAVDGAAPAALALAAPAPNPVRERALLHFVLPRAMPARLAVYDAAGRLVQALASGTLAAGPHDVRFARAGEDGHALSPGIYLVRLEAGGRALTRRLVLAP